MRDLVGRGGWKPDITWPNGARLAVSVVVNFEEGAEQQVGDGDLQSQPLLDRRPRRGDRLLRDVGPANQALSPPRHCRPMSARDAITQLASAFQFDAVEQDDVLLFRKRARSVVATVPYADLVQERTDASALSEQRVQDAELPRELTVRHLDVDWALEPDAQSWRRPVSPTPTVVATAISTLDLPIPLTGGEAKAIARRLITAAWRERTWLTFTAGPRHARLVPTDPIILGLADDATIRCRVLSTQLGANRTTRIEAVAEDAAAYAHTAPTDGGSGWVPPTLPLLLDADDLGGAGLREYALIGGYRGQVFPGATLFRSQDLLAWEEIGAVTRSAAGVAQPLDLG